MRLLQAALLLLQLAAAASGAAAQPAPTIPCSTALLTGRRASQEDRAVCWRAIIPCGPPQPQPHASEVTATGAAGDANPASFVTATLAAVYDGHGGSRASQHLADTLHLRVIDALAALLQRQRTCQVSAGDLERLLADSIAEEVRCTVLV